MQPFLDPSNPADIERAAALLREGSVVALPTETVYGLAANALDERAVRQIFEIKQRPLIDPLIVHVDSWESLERLALPTEQACRLAKAFWPGPLTLILRKRPIVPDLVTAGLPTVALRMSAHPVMRAVGTAAQCPLAAPSANPFGYISPTTATHVRDSLKERQPWIVDGGPCAHGLESTIVDVSNPANPPRILRHGPIAAEAIAAALDMAPEALQQAPVPVIPETQGQIAPGLLKRHYSPHTPLTLIEAGTLPPAPSSGLRAAWVMLKRPRQLPQRPEGLDIFFLSEDGQLETLAHNVFALLRALDKAAYTGIFIEMPPAEGIGAALRDRLHRAAAR